MNYTLTIVRDDFNMNTIVALCLAACICMAYGEQCMKNSDCTNGFTTCADGHALTCHEQQCFCEMTVTGGTGSNSGCSAKDDCITNGQCHGGRGKWHCVDARCRCLYF